MTVTECTKQTVTNWLQYAHIADYGRGTASRDCDAQARRLSNIVWLAGGIVINGL